MFRKTKLLFLLLTLISFYANAQIDTSDNDVDTVINQEEFRNQVLADLKGHINPCEVGSFNEVSVVRFQSYANAYIPYSPQFAGKEIAFYIDGEKEEKIKSIDFKDGKPVFLTKLPLNNSFTIKVRDNCGDLQIVGGFNTFNNAKFDERIVVGSKFNDFLSGVVEESSNPQRLFDLIVANPAYSYYERLSFIQDYFYDGQPFNDALDFYKIDSPIDFSKVTQKELFIRWDILDRWLKEYKKDCNCKVLIVNEVGPNEDGSLNISQGGLSPSYPITDDGNVIVYDQSKKYDLWQSYSRVGATKYEQIWQEAKRAGTRGFEVSQFADGVFPGFYSKISYNLLCTNPHNYQIPCGCEKDLDIGFSYLGFVETYVDKVKGTSKAKAVAKDFAMFVIDNGVDEPFVKSNLIGIEQAYEQTIDPSEAMKGVLSIVKGVIKLTKWGKKQTDEGINSISDGIVGTVNGIKNWKKVPVGSLGIKQNSGLLVDGIKKIKLKPNQVVNIILYSGTELQLEGTKKWHSHARSVSSSYLTTFIPCGIPEGESGSCLTTGAASWMGYSTKNGGNQGILDHMDNFFYIRGYNNLNNKYLGAFSGLCPPMQERPNVEEENDLFKMVKEPEVIVGPFYYSIINMPGQVLMNGDYSESEFNLQKFNKQLDLPSGIYFLRVIDKNNNIKVVKFFHN